MAGSREGERGGGRRLNPQGKRDKGGRKVARGVQCIEALACAALASVTGEFILSSFTYCTIILLCMLTHLAYITVGHEVLTISQNLFPQMDAAQLVVNNAVLAERIAELEAELVQATQERQEAQLQNAELHGRVSELEEKNLDLVDELARVKEDAEFIDEQRLETDDEMAQVRHTNEQQVVQINHLQAQWAAAQNNLAQAEDMIGMLQMELDEVHNDFDQLMEIHMEHHNPQPLAVEEPDVVQGASGLEYEPPSSPMDEDVLSDADSTMPRAE